MRWNKFRLKTTTEAEDLVSSMLMDLGIEGVEIEDKVPLTQADKEQMFVDILPQIESDVKIPDENYVDGYKEVLKNMGYRLWISMAELKNTAKGSRLKLTWENSGVAPMYKEWPVYVYIEDESGKLVEKSRISIKISSLFPGEKATTLTALETERLNSLLEKGYWLSVGIEDPMTELPCVRFAMETLYQEGKNYLW